MFEHKAEWEAMTERMGCWLDMEDAYATMSNDYMESEWWALKVLFDKGLLYKGLKVLPYCAATGVTYSSHEVEQGYKTVVDVSFFVKFKLCGKMEGAQLLAWTTTPWTLPANQALAVCAELEYSEVALPV